MKTFRGYSVVTSLPPLVWKNANTHTCSLTHTPRLAVFVTPSASWREKRPAVGRGLGSRGSVDSISICHLAFKKYLLKFCFLARITCSIKMEVILITGPGPPRLLLTSSPLSARLYRLCQPPVDGDL